MTNVNPYDLHPLIPAGVVKKKKNKLLTRKQIFDIIDKQVESLKHNPAPTWGFSKDDVIRMFEEVRQEVGGKEG